MYKVSLKSGHQEFGKEIVKLKSSCVLTIAAAECLDIVCRTSAKDATLLYACVMEAQRIGDKRQTIHALEQVLNKYDYTAPTGIHLPALLR